MLIQTKACERIQSLLNSSPFNSSRDDILINHSLKGLLQPESNEWKTQYFRMAVQEQLLKEMSIDQTIAEQFIVLKGMSFSSYGLYASFGDRLTSDIDLLVNDLEKISEYLKSQNFSLVANHIWKGNDFKRVYSKQISGIEVVVELHTRLFYHTSFNQFNFIKSKVGFMVLGLEDLLVHLVGHLAFQHTFLKIHWLLDIHLLMEMYRDELDMKRVNYLLEKLKLIRSWKMTQKYIALFFHGKPEENILKKFVYTLNFLFFPNNNKLTYYIVKHLTKDHFLTSFSYNFFWLVQKGWKK